MSYQPTIVVHGGADAYTTVGHGGITREMVYNGVIDAANAGYDILKQNGTAVDAVQAAVMSMEDNPIFDAGVGSYFTAAKTIEMDALIMDGSTLRTGATCSITNVKNAVKVARLVMDETVHTMVNGEGARTLAKKHGVEVVSTEGLTSKRSLKIFEDNPGFASLSDLDKGGEPPKKDPDEHDTVGAVALDSHGNVAVASSTGGLNWKMVGRVGDTPLVGAGSYADNQSGAVTATGDGEAMVKVCTCKHTAMLMEQDMTPQEAVDITLEITRVRGKGVGGLIAVNRKGETGITFNTTGMSWAKIQEDVVHYGIYKDEHLTKEYPGKS